MLTKSHLAVIFLLLEAAQTRYALLKVIKRNQALVNVAKAQDKQIAFLVGLLERNGVEIDEFEQIILSDLFNHPDL